MIELEQQVPNFAVFRLGIRAHIDHVPALRAETVQLLHVGFSVRAGAGVMQCDDLVFVLHDDETFSSTANSPFCPRASMRIIRSTGAQS